MERVVVIGNSGGGKSVLSRQLAAKLQLPYIDVDSILWLPGWQIVPAEAYQSEHSRLIAQERWLIDGLGMPDSIPSRLARATDVVLIDMPLWMHFWLAAERQIRWTAGQLPHPPGGFSEPPPTHGLFKTIWEVDRDWMPEIRSLVGHEETRGKRIFRLASVEDLDGFLSRPDL
ncbi:MAG TPA: adenylate kinase [Thermoanaerobaculia bacterium]